MITGAKFGDDSSLRKMIPKRKIEIKNDKKQFDFLTKKVLTPVNTVSYSIPGALKSGSETGQSVLVFFYNNFNTTSKKFYNQILKDRSVFNILKSKGPLCIIDCDRRAGDMKKYSVWQIPTILIISSDGRELSRLEKYEGVEKMLQWVRENRQQGLSKKNNKK